MVKIITVLHLLLSTFLIFYFRLYKNNTVLDLLIISFVILLSYFVSSSNVLNRSDYLSLKLFNIDDVYTKIVKFWHIFVTSVIIYMIYNRNGIRQMYYSNKECYDRYMKCIAVYILFTHGNRLYNQLKK